MDSLPDENPIPTDSELSTRKASVARSLIESGCMENEDAASFVDCDDLRETVARVKAAFPGNFAHSFAVKSNFYVPVLRVLREAGIGAEVASPVELELALEAGFEPEDMVCDGPIKKREEIERILKLGIVLNIDNFQELDIVTELHEATGSSSIAGFRINPQIGAGSVALSSTATDTSKFGVGLRDEGLRERLIKEYVERPWMQCIHVHVGSVGCPVELLAEGAGQILELANEIDEAAGEERITHLDIGGGLPVSFMGDEDTPTFEEYATALRKRAPALFGNRYRVFTEFGRAIVSKNAFTIARVEYTKTMGGRHIALTHGGAHNLSRLIFQPVDWARRVTALDARGSVKEGELVPQDVAGPCCFSGDIIAHERELPLLEPGDYVFVHDTGAYLFTNHFYYNALPMGAVYGFENDGDAYRFDLFKAGQTIEDLKGIFG